VQNEPNLVRLRRIQNPLFHKDLRQSGRLRITKSKPKANPNKPKQSQSDPDFSPVRGSQSQNKPKQTQTNPIFVPLVLFIVYNCPKHSEFDGQFSVWI
jgi:hypothetical protein